MTICNKITLFLIKREIISNSDIDIFNYGIFVILYNMFLIFNILIIVILFKLPGSLHIFRTKLSPQYLR